MGSCGPAAVRAAVGWRGGEDRNYRIAQGCPPVETTSGAGKELPSGHHQQQQKAPPMLPLLPRGLRISLMLDFEVKKFASSAGFLSNPKKRLSLTKMGRTALYQRVNLLISIFLPVLQGSGKNENQAEF